MDVYHRLFWHGQSNDLFDLPGIPGQTWAWTPSFQDFSRVFTLWFYDHLEVSWNGSTPKSSILVGSIINQPAIGDPKFTELPSEHPFGFTPWRVICTTITSLQTLIQADGKAVKIISQRVGNQTWQQKMPHVFFWLFSHWLVLIYIGNFPASHDWLLDDRWLWWMSTSSSFAFLGHETNLTVRIWFRNDVRLGGERSSWSSNPLINQDR